MSCCIRRSGRCAPMKCRFSCRTSCGKAVAGLMPITRVFNPVWTYPDGFSWIEMLRDEEKLGLHAALTPTWSETAWFADYVLPMGFSSERHDLMSQESYAGKWIGFRQPIHRVLRERAGEKFDFTYQANPGAVWEEDEFWINLSWAIDPDGSMGIGSILNRRTGQDKSSPSMNITDGFLRTPCPGSPRPRKSRV